MAAALGTSVDMRQPVGPEPWEEGAGCCSTFLSPIDLGSEPLY